MNRWVKYSICALALFSAPSVYADDDDDKARFESSGFLKSLDVLLNEQKEKKLSAGNAKIENINGLDLSLSSSSSKDDSAFLTLSDRRPTFNGTSSELDSRPDFSSLLSPTGELRGSYGRDVFGVRQRLGLSFGGDNAPGSHDHGFEIAIESRYRQSVQGVTASPGFADFGLLETQYSAGLSLGYYGFGIDASVTRQSGQFSEDLEGFEAGFSYSGNAWSARFSMGEYTEGSDLYGIENLARSIVSFELGANYRLTERFGLSGGVRYYDYGSSFVTQTNDGENSQMIFLGGRLRF